HSSLPSAPPAIYPRSLHDALPICEPEWLDLPEVPIVVLEHTMAERLTATMQFNRARGVHQVDLDAEVVRALLEQGLSEEEIATKLGMDADTVHRYKQLTGVAELFKNAEYSLAWEMADDDGDTKES